MLHPRRLFVLLMLFSEFREYADRRKRLCARSDTGFELHADGHIPVHDRAALERLCRYLARPPIAEDRLVKRQDGRTELRLKRT